MASSASADTELLTEHFGYPPVSLLDDIINSVNILAERALSSVEQALLRQPPASLGFRPAKKGTRPEDREAAEAAAAEAHRLEVENGTHQLETLLCASIDRNFDKFELYVMRNILCVQPEDRDWIRLAHYEGLDFTAVSREGGEGGDNVDVDVDVDGVGDGDGTKGEEGGGGGGGPPSDAAIARLHRRLQASQKLGCLLEAEMARNDVMLAQLRALAGSSSSSGSSGSINSSTDTAAAMGASVAKSEPSPEPPCLTSSWWTSSSSSSSSSLGFLLDRGPLTESDVAAPLTTTTAFALSQLPALRQLSDTLRQMAPGLMVEGSGSGSGSGSGRGRSSVGDDDDHHGDRSWRRERLEYVEGATRKHLERTRGLGLGRNGEVVRGDGSQPPTGSGSGSGSGSGNGNGNGNGGGAMAIEPDALTNILSILREHQRPEPRAPPTQKPDGEAMDES